MTLYIFDYQGTLTTLPDAVGFLRDLRSVDPDCVIAMMSGSDDIDPAVLASMDYYWVKPCYLPDEIKQAGLTPTRMVYADDEPLMRRAAARFFRSAEFEVQVVEPEGLQGLLTG